MPWIGRLCDLQTVDNNSVWSLEIPLLSPSVTALLSRHHMSHIVTPSTPRHSLAPAGKCDRANTVTPANNEPGLSTWSLAGPWPGPGWGRVWEHWPLVTRQIIPSLCPPVVCTLLLLISAQTSTVNELVPTQTDIYISTQRTGLIRFYCLQVDTLLAKQGSYNTFLLFFIYSIFDVGKIVRQIST